MEAAFLKRPEGFWELTGFYFLLKGLDNFLIVLLTSLFLEKYGASGLPGFYILVNLLFITSQIAMMGSREWAGYGFLATLSRPLVITVLMMAAVTAGGNAAAIFAALLFVTVYDFHATQAFSDLSSHILPLREAKEHLPTVWAAGTAGSILSGLSVRFAVDLGGFVWTFGGVAVLLLVSDGLLRRLGGIISAQEAVTTEQTVTPASAPETAAAIWSSLPMGTRRFSCLLIGLSFAAIFGRMLMDFLYNSQMSVAFPAARDLAGILGLFWAAIDIVSLLMQTVIGRWIFATLRLGTIIAIRAGALTMTALVGAWFPGPVTAAIGWFVLMTMTKAFINPGFVIMLEPIPRAARVMVRRFISVGDALANIAAGTMLLSLKAGAGRGNESLIFLVVAVLYGVSLIASRLLDDWYSQTVEETLQQTDVEGDVEIIHALRFVSPIERQSRMARLLQHADPDIRYRTIMETAELPSEQTADLLLTALVNEKEPRNVAAMVRVILMRLGQPGEELIEDLLLHEQDPRLIADIIESLQAGENERMTGLLPMFLEHPHHRVRGNAVKTLLRRCEDRSVLERCLACLRQLMESTIEMERATAAVVMGTTGLPAFVPALGCLADDEQPEVAGHALQSLARIGSANAVRLLAEKRVRGRFRDLAERAWKQLHAQGAEERGKLLAGLSAADRARVGFWLKAVQSSADEQLLFRILRVRDADKRDALLRALGAEDLDTHELLDACVRQEGDEAVLDPVPFFEKLKAQSLDRFPPWGDLVTTLCGSQHAEYVNVLIPMLKRVAREMFLYERGVSEGVFADQTVRDTLDARIDKRLRVVLHFVALAGRQPAETLEALVKATTRDKFVHSVALEFIEEQLGRTISETLFPLLERTSDELRQEKLAEICEYDLRTFDRMQLVKEVGRWLDASCS